MNEDKADVRRRCRETREGLPIDKVEISSRAVCTCLSDWPQFQQANTVLAFLAFRNEIKLNWLFEHWTEKRWLMPRVVGGTELRPGQKPYLALHPYDPERLVRHRFGMFEPEADLPTIEPNKVEMILVPGVAFDRNGGRLGFGGGFYDRLLPLAQRAIRVGVTYDQLVLDALPMEPWDCRMDWLVTPAGMLKTASDAYPVPADRLDASR